MLKKIFIICSLCLSVYATAGAAVQSADFSCRGLYIGDTYEQMKAAFGEPRYDMDWLVQGVMVRYYMYPHEVKVGLDLRTKTVRDIQIKDKAYVARDGIKLGATPYKIKQVYGQTQKQMIEGSVYYIYRSGQKDQARLLLQTDPAEGYLEAFRLTNLPLAEEISEDEADVADEPDRGDVNDLFIKSKEIDVSNVQPVN